VAGPLGAGAAAYSLGRGVLTGEGLRTVGTAFLRAAGGAMYGAPDLGKAIMIGARQYEAGLDAQASQAVKAIGGGQWDMVENRMEKGLRLRFRALQARSKELAGSPELIAQLHSVAGEAARVLERRISPDERIIRFVEGTNEVGITRLPEAAMHRLAFHPKYRDFRDEVMRVQDYRLKEMAKRYEGTIPFLKAPEEEFRKVVEKRGLPKGVVNLLSDLSATGLLSKESRRILREMEERLSRRK